MNSLTLDQKAVALNSLSPLSIKIRHDGKYYTSHQSVSYRFKSGVVTTEPFGDTPYTAISMLWDRYMAADYIIKTQPAGPAKNFRWNGFMWEELSEAP